MKTLTKIYLTLFIGILACNESDDIGLVEESIINKWIYTQDATQTISFLDATNALVNENEFTYMLDEDSIQFTYNGPLFIAINPSKHKYELSTGKLTIENLNILQFFTGAEGENILTNE